MNRSHSRQPQRLKKIAQTAASYEDLLTAVMQLVESGRQMAARSVNSILTTTYWRIGQRIVEHEQKGTKRAAYGRELLKQLARDLTEKVGRGFSQRNLEQMRLFYLTWPGSQTGSVGFEPAGISQTVSAKSDATPQFPLPWSHYVRLLSVSDQTARLFYEHEAIRGSWSARQLDRQIATLAFERSSRVPALEGEATSADAHVRDPFILEFLDLKDEYSETDLEDGLIRTMEQFLLEMGNDFAFVARQKRLRVGDEWYRVDLVFFHRVLRCLVIIDLKIGKFTHSDAGQMNLYLNYAREHWTHGHENPPVGLILCSQKDTAVAHYALGNLANQVLAREYRLNLPDEAQITDRMSRARRALEN